MLLNSLHLRKRNMDLMLVKLIQSGECVFFKLMDDEFCACWRAKSEWIYISVNSWVASHNTVRERYFTSPVEWSDELAAVAQKVTDTCVFEHSHGAYGEVRRKSYYGFENLTKSLMSFLSSYSSVEHCSWWDRFGSSGERLGLWKGWGLSLWSSESNLFSLHSSALPSLCLSLTLTLSLSDLTLTRFKKKSLSLRTGLEGYHSHRLRLYQLWFDPRCHLVWWK